MISGTEAPHTFPIKIPSTHKNPFKNSFPFMPRFHFLNLQTEKKKKTFIYLLLIKVEQIFIHDQILFNYFFSAIENNNKIHQKNLLSFSHFFLFFYCRGKNTLLNNPPKPPHNIYKYSDGSVRRKTCVI